MSEVHAVVGLASLRNLDTQVEERARLATLYRRRLMHLPGIKFQSVQGENACSFKDLGLRIVDAEFGATRDAVRAALRTGGVDTRTYFDPPVHRQRAYAGRCNDALPVTDRLSSEILDLPIYPGLSDAALAYVCDLIENACPNR